jgi:hypothetical protein
MFGFERVARRDGVPPLVNDAWPIIGM